MTYIPSILWDRKTQLLENCTNEQKIDTNLRYQKRLGESDFELWTKHIGEQYFHKTPILAFGQLPAVEDEEYYPIKDRLQQNMKRTRSESPITRNTQARMNASVTEEGIPSPSSQEEEILNIVMDHQEEIGSSS